jgi:hypothetical protein
MSSICEKLTISEPICVAESYAVSSLNNDSMIYGNKALMVYFGIFLVVFVLALLIGYTNSSAAYYGLIKPSWALSLTTWTFLLALVFFLTAFAAIRI